MKNHASHGPVYDQRLLAQVRESFGRAVYSHKIHEKQADISFSRYQWQQGTLIALSAVSSGTFLTLVFGLFGNSTLTSIVTSFCALLVSWMSLGAKTFKFDETSAIHRDVASNLWDIRESYISLIADMMSGQIADLDARKRRDELQSLTRDVYSAAPRTSGKAFVRAQDGLKNHEEMTFTTREIDMFLPEALRLGGEEGQL